MSTESFRAAVFGAIQAWGATGFPTLPLVYENGPVPDEDKIGPIWLDIELRFYSGHLAAMGDTPLVRQSGAVSVSCYYRRGEGTSQTDKVIDSLSTALLAKRLGGGVLFAPQRIVPAPTIRGWYKTGILVPFTYG